MFNFSILNSQFSMLNFPRKAGGQCPAEADRIKQIQFSLAWAIARHPSIESVVANLHSSTLALGGDRGSRQNFQNNCRDLSAKKLRLTRGVEFYKIANLCNFLWLACRVFGKVAPAVVPGMAGVLRSRQASVPGKTAVSAIAIAPDAPDPSPQLSDFDRQIVW